MSSFFNICQKCSRLSTVWAMSLRLTCPCGTSISGEDDDQLVVLTMEHLGAEHPGLEYSREEILFLAM